MSPKTSKEQQAPALLRYEEDFKEWLGHPTTQKLLRWAKNGIEARKDDWANGNFDASFMHEQIVREAVAKGFISGMVSILDLEAKDLEDNE